MSSNVIQDGGALVEVVARAHALRFLSYWTARTHALYGVRGAVVVPMDPWKPAGAVVAHLGTITAPVDAADDLTMHRRADAQGRHDPGQQRRPQLQQP